MQPRSYINCKANKTRNATKIMIIESSDVERKIYSDIFHEIFQNSIVLKYAFINEAMHMIDHYFHIDFFLINAYSLHKSCSSFVKKIRSLDKFNTSYILITTDQYIDSAPSKINVMNYCRSFKNTTLIKKPLNAFKLSISILKLLPEQIHYFKRLEVINKEMKKYHINKTKTKEKNTRPRRNSENDIVKFPPI